MQAGYRPGRSSQKTLAVVRAARCRGVAPPPAEARLPTMSRAKDRKWSGTQPAEARVSWMRAVLPATAASAGAPAATTAAEATPATAAAPITAAATRAWGLRLFDLDRPAVEVRAVEAANGLLGFLGSRHLDEPEAPRTPGVPVGHDTRGLDAADRRESFAQALVGGGEG